MAGTSAGSEYEWIETEAALLDLIQALLPCAAYGIDTEFHRERTYWPKLALVQIAGGDRVALIDPLAVDVRPLGDLFGSLAVAVMHAGEQDLEIFERAVGALPDPIFDTQIAAGFLGLRTPSLASLLRSVLDVRLPKADRLTDWLRRPLGAHARDYAAADVAQLLDLHAALTERLRAAGREDWALEECEVFRTKSRGPQDPETAWWRLKGSRRLRGPARGVAQELAAWRERRAAAADVPARRLMSDLALSGMAERAPADTDELARVRGLDGRQLRKGVDLEIMDAIARGMSLPASELRLPAARHGPQPPRALVTLCAAYAAQVAEDNDLDVSLLASRDDLADFVQGHETPLRRGWRYALVGGGIERLRAGRAALMADRDGHLRLTGVDMTGRRDRSDMARGTPRDALET